MIEAFFAFLSNNMQHSAHAKSPGKYYHEIRDLDRKNLEGSRKKGTVDDRVNGVKERSEEGQEHL